MRIPAPVIAIVLIAAAVLAVVLVLRSADTPAPSAVPGATSGTPSTPSIPNIPSIPAGAEPAEVEYVHDGDTLFLTDGTKVRLLGIDTPEIGDNLECYGPEATALLRQLLPEGTRVEVLADVEPLDQYGRALLFVYTADGTNVSLAMIEAGMAEAVVLAPNLLLSDELEAAEDRAQAAGTGLWSAC